MTTWFRHTGDIGDTLRPELVGGVADLTAATAVSATVTGCDGTTAIILTGTIIDAAAKIVELDLSPWLDTAPIDTYDVKTHVDFGASQRITWPASPTKDKLIVLP